MILVEISFCTIFFELLWLYILAQKVMTCGSVLPVVCRYALCYRAVPPVESIRQEADALKARFPPFYMYLLE